MSSHPAEAVRRDGPATVVIGERVRPGRAEDHRRWQDEVSAVAATFPGYLGTEVGASGDPGEVTVVYRFDTPGHLHAWLESPERARLLERGADLHDAPGDQQVVVGTSGDAEMVTVVVSHTVRPEDEADFLAWQRRLSDAERRSPGHRGGELLRPVPGVQDDWVAVTRFATEHDLETWLASAARHDLLAEGERFRDFRLRRVTTSFGSWFTGDAGAAAAPPSWKTALSVLLGLYPTVVLLTLAISALWPAGPLWASLLVGNVASVSLLTWVVMPVVTRALRFWLEPAPPRGPRTDVLGTVASLMFLAVAAGVFAVLTT
jgi:uncharacterized protein